MMPQSPLRCWRHTGWSSQTVPRREMAPETYAHVIPADDQAAAQLVGDLYRAPMADLL